MRPLSEFTAEQFNAWFSHTDQCSPQVVTYHCPPGTPNCEPITVFRQITPGGTQVIVGWQLDDTERDMVARGGTIWLVQNGGLAPHSLHVVGPHVNGVHCDECGAMLPITDQPCHYCVQKKRPYTPECEVNKHTCEPT